MSILVKFFFIWEKEGYSCREKSLEKSVCEALCLPGQKHQVPCLNLVYLFCMSKMYVLTGEAALENQDAFQIVCILWLPSQQLPLPPPGKKGQKLCTNIRRYDLIRQLLSCCAFNWNWGHTTYLVIILGLCTLGYLGWGQVQFFF